MMQIRNAGLVLGFLGLTGCITGQDGKRDTGKDEPDTQEDTGTQDTDTIWDDTACDEPSGDRGEDKEAVDPRVVARLGTINFTAAGESAGFYFVDACATNINAKQAGDGDTLVKLVMDLEGSLDFAGSYNIITLTLMEQQGQAGNNWEYTVERPSDATFDVVGFGPGDTVFGSLSAAVTLEGGGETADMESLVLEGWPTF
jgi:hypothetical protein